MNDIAILAVMDYADKHLFEPKNNWDKDEFKQRSYSRWAVSEMLTLLSENPFTLADEIVYEFVVKMIYFKAICQNKSNEQIFSTAADIADDILMMLV